MKNWILGYTPQELEFWYGAPPDEIVDFKTCKFWKYCTIEGYKQQAQKDANSLPLLLYAPDQVYQNSKRPKTDMLMFRTSGAILLKHKPNGKTEINGVEWEVLPVTRYASGMSRGLYYSEEVSEQYCGTYYYLEPESTTFLAYKKSLTFKNKYQAALALEKQLGKEHFNVFGGENVKFLRGESNWPENLMITPNEVIAALKDLPYHKFPNIEFPQRKKYVGKYLSIYGAEDVLDQYICKMGREIGVDIIIFTNMVGSHQIVTEILDVRNRMESFDSLIYIE